MHVLDTYAMVNGLNKELGVRVKLSNNLLLMIGVLCHSIGAPPMDLLEFADGLMATAFYWDKSKLRTLAGYLADLH